MKTDNEKTIINIIKYAPIVVIIFFSLIGTYFLDYSSNIQYKKDVKKINNFYTKINKDELVEEVNRVYEYILIEEKNSRETLRKLLKTRVNEAHSIATRIYEDNKDDKSKEEILVLIQSALGSIIYNNGRGYFFINNVHGVNLLQPLNRKIEYQNILELEDVNGYKFIKTMVESIKNKTEMFDTYYWYKNEKDKIAYEKISFFKYFEPLNITIGTGEYLEDFKSEIKNRVIEYVQSIKLKDSRYIFLLKGNGEVLAHKNQEIVGQNLSHKNEKYDYSFFKDFKNILSTKDEGFISYTNATLFSQSAYKKTSFIKSYRNWDWVIGTGYSDEDLEKIISESQRELEKQKQQNFNTLLIMNLFITVCLLIISTIISKKLEKIFRNYKNIITKEENKFKNLFEHSNIALVISNSKEEFLEVNNKFLEILKYNKKENLKNKTWRDIVLDYDKEFERIFYSQEDYFSFEKTLKNHKNERVDIFLTAKNFRENGKIKYILFSIIDISNVKKKDKILYQQSKMASMGEMLANIAHQWRQPLSVITAASTGAKFNIEADIVNTKDLIPTLENINESAIHLSQIIEDFRNFFNPNQNSIVEFEIKDALEKTLGLVSAQFTAKDIVIIKDIENVKIKSLKNELIQALVNILNNSRDALLNMDGKKYIFIHIQKLNNELEIKLYDNARGIDKKILTRVFEPYFTTKHQSVGTGIGLYMTQDIVLKLLKGNIVVENKKFKYEDEEYIGACFTITLPLNKL